MHGVAGSSSPILRIPLPTQKRFRTLGFEASQHTHPPCNHIAGSRLPVDGWVAGLVVGLVHTHCARKTSIATSHTPNKHPRYVQKEGIGLLVARDARDAEDAGKDARDVGKDARDAAKDARDAQKEAREDVPDAGDAAGVVRDAAGTCGTCGTRGDGRGTMAESRSRMFLRTRRLSIWQ